MSQTGSNFEESVTAWADITMKVLFQRMDALQFGNKSEHLRKSLEEGRLKVSGRSNDQYRIAFRFNLYGRFADMGVGREFSRGNDGRNIQSGRLPREWLSRYWWAQFQRLKEIMKKKYKDASVDTVMDELSQIMGGAKTMKGFLYAVSQSARNARNYARRRALPGKWTNNHKTWKPNQWK